MVKAGMMPHQTRCLTGFRLILPAARPSMRSTSSACTHNYTVENTPTETQTFTLYGLIAFDVQYWNGSTWMTVPGGSVTGNNKVWRKFAFAQITTSKIRVFINQVPDSWSRVVEIQAYEPSTNGENIQWLVP